MTRDELHIAFKIEMDKNSLSVAYGGCPAFLPEEVDYWLDKGYYDVLTTKFSGLNTTQTAFEGSVKRIADLERLIRTDSNLLLTSIKGTNKLVLNNLLDRTENNEGRMFFVNAVLHWNDNQKNSNKKSAIIELVNHDVANRFQVTNSNNPWIESPVAIIENNQLIIYIDLFEMLGDFTVDITYVKYPTLISKLLSNLNLTEIPEYVQNEIVNKAVQLALDNIESLRIQTKSLLNTLVD